MGSPYPFDAYRPSPARQGSAPRAPNLLDMRSRGFIAPLLALATFAPVSSAHAADMPIQPGAPASSPVGGCTMNFVFHDQNDVKYIAIAAHCIDVGQRATASGIGEFGTAVYERFNGDDDFALIKIDPSRYASVNPAMRNWGGPTGYTSYTETTVGDRLLYHGYGIGVGSNAVTRSRAGALSADNIRAYNSVGLATFGDSGGPVLHAATGKALGLANNIVGGPTSLVNGSTIERLVDKASEEAGLVLTLETAPYTAPF